MKFESFNDVLSNNSNGTVVEMQYRYLFAAIRKAADDCEREVTIELYKLDCCRPILIKEILESAGFDVSLTSNAIGQDAITVQW